MLLRNVDISLQVHMVLRSEDERAYFYCRENLKTRINYITSSLNEDSWVQDIKQFNFTGIKFLVNSGIDIFASDNMVYL